MKTNIAFLLCLLLTFSLPAQKEPIKWGKVDPVDLEMKTYDLDPEAEAVVLTDYGTLHFDISTGDLFYIFEHHVRIKILKKSAFERGNIEIPYYTDDNLEKIISIKAQVILPNGKKVRVDKKDIFEEKINSYWSQLNFAFPALEEGCIIEYKYTKKSELIYYLEDWYFQSDIPTRLSEFRTNIPDWFKYISFSQGLNFNKEESQTYRNIPIPRQRKTRDQIGVIDSRTTLAGSTIETAIITTRYFLENAPALQPERFITTMNDYYSKLSLQLQSIQFPNSLPQDVSSTWSKKAKELEESSNFGDQLNKKKYTKKLMEAVAPLLASAENDLEKISIIYSFINHNIKWNENYGIFSSSLDDVFDKKAGTSGELNLMFIALCRQIGIESYPVLTSTRSHGKTMQYYPKTDQFNHVIAFVQIEETQKLFDLGNLYRDPTLLRMNSLNYYGWLVNGEKSQWINIIPASDTEITMMTLGLENNGNLTGTINQSFKGYCAMDGRANFYKNKNESQKHIREEWQQKFPDVEIKTIHFENEEKTSEALKCELEISIPQAAQISDDFIYLSPMLGMGFEENPLKKEKRTFPVDIPIGFKNQYILNLTIPEGYTIDELPEPLNLAMHGDGGSFLFRVSKIRNTIQIISKINITKLHYEPEEYGIIKNFFDIIVEKHNEQIVLKKG